MVARPGKRSQCLSADLRQHPGEAERIVCTEKSLRPRLARTGTDRLKCALPITRLRATCFARINAVQLVLEPGAKLLSRSSLEPCSGVCCNLPDLSAPPATAPPRHRRVLPATPRYSHRLPTPPHPSHEAPTLHPPLPTLYTVRAVCRLSSITASASLCPPTSAICANAIGEAGCASRGATPATTIGQAARTHTTRAGPREPGPMLPAKGQQSDQRQRATARITPETSVCVCVCVTPALSPKNGSRPHVFFF